MDGDGDGENVPESSQPQAPYEDYAATNHHSERYPPGEPADHTVIIEDEEHATEGVSPRRSKRQRRPPTKLSPGTAGRSTDRNTRRPTKYSPEYLLNNPKSALVDLPDLSMFVNEDVFRKLSVDDRREIMHYVLPIDRSSSTSPVPGFFGNAVLQDTARQLQVDIGLGRYTKTYAEEYRRASVAIANGEAEEYKESQIELWWGQKAKGIDVD
ncbi:hypothetical protein V1525DRAFT_29804 [Lipomyces kononenkoae]|uniref:Uncharacterized protein n=1 Tax=Lipomyces kononenkoae TaxID=34357 RepID=A0ACC3SU22_LIPKO